MQNTKTDKTKTASDAPEAPTEHDCPKCGQHFSTCICETQPQHSPLPWTIDADGDIQDQWGNKIAEMQYTYDADRQLIVASVNHAQALASALRDVTTAAEIVDNCETPDKSDIEHMLDCFEKAHKALANWEKAK